MTFYSHNHFRFCCVDFVFVSGVRHFKYRGAFVSYDIVCQWAIRLKERVKDLPFDVEIDLSTFPFVFLVPKFHLPAHVRKCQVRFSFNLQPGVGRTDGEGIERDWSGLNPLATSVREMGPGSRHDTLDDHFGDWNFRRTVALRELTLSSSSYHV